MRHGKSVLMVLVGLLLTVGIQIVKAQERVGCDATDIMLVTTEKFSACYRYDNKDLFLWYVHSSPNECHITWNYQGESLDGPSDSERSVSENSNCTIPGKLKVGEWSMLREGKKIERVWLALKDPAENIDLSAYLGLTSRYARVTGTFTLNTSPGVTFEESPEMELSSEVLITGFPVMTDDELVWWPVQTLSSVLEQKFVDPKIPSEVGWLPESVLQFAEEGSLNMRRYFDGVSTCFYSPVGTDRRDWREIQYIWGLIFPEGALNGNFRVILDGAEYTDVLLENGGVYLPYADWIGAMASGRSFGRWQLVVSPC